MTSLERRKKSVRGERKVELPFVRDKRRSSTLGQGTRASPSSDQEGHWAAP